MTPSVVDFPFFYTKKGLLNLQRLMHALAVLGKSMYLPAH